jgi:hypothetical protein
MGSIEVSVEAALDFRGEAEVLANHDGWRAPMSVEKQGLR